MRNEPIEHGRNSNHPPRIAGIRTSHIQADTKDEVRDRVQSIADQVCANYGEEAWATCLIPSYLVDPNLVPAADEVRPIRNWGMSVQADGTVYRQASHQMIQLPVHATRLGRRYAKGSNDFKVWIANEMFVAFCGPVPHGWRTEPIDGDHSNCTLRNLILLREPEDQGHPN